MILKKTYIELKSIHVDPNDEKNVSLSTISYVQQICNIFNYFKNLCH
jgi:hypothetical protein